MKSKMIISILLSLAVVGCSRVDETPPVVAKTAPPACATEAGKPVNTEMPSLKITTYAGECYNLADHRGKWVVVNFWATWCEPCKKEIPEFNELDKKREDVDFIGLAYEEIERADMDAFLKVIPIDYPMAILDVYSPPADFDTPRGLPLTYVISPDGKVASKFLGPVTLEELEKVINKSAATEAEK